MKCYFCAYLTIITMLSLPTMDTLTNIWSIVIDTSSIVLAGWKITFIDVYNIESRTHVSMEYTSLKRCFAWQKYGQLINVYLCHNVDPANHLHSHIDKIHCCSDTLHCFCMDWILRIHQHLKWSLEYSFE